VITAGAPDESDGAPCRRWSPRLALQVRLRFVDLGSPNRGVARAATCLSPAELRVAERGTGHVRRRRILLRAALRAELGRQLGVPAAEVPLAAGPGRPRWAAEPGPDLDMSCSASGSVGLVAVVRGARVGVDVQQCLPEDLGAARAEGWLADDEYDLLARLPEQDRSVALARCWAAKEAVLKGRGVGLLIDPATVRTAGRWAVGGWRLLSVPAPAGHTAAVAVRSRSRLPRPVVVHVAGRGVA
jgi:4'-phosphopantetheinyl transferase